MQLRLSAFYCTFFSDKMQDKSIKMIPKKIAEAPCMVYDEIK